jgi:inosine-uridine nucleoside N-ribohydrolase
VPLAKKNADGAPVYSHGIHKLNDTAEVTALIRNAFTAQQDQNSVVIVGGPANNLVKVLDLPGAKELISQKVRVLAVAGGAYPDGPPEFNIKTDIAAAKTLFADWPTPIVASGYEIGDALRFPAASIEKDFAWTPAHPVVDAYRAYKPMPYDAPTWDMAAALYAARPEEGYFKLSEPGTIRVMDDGHTKFTPSPDGKHRYLILDPGQKERIIRMYTEMASAKPVTRAPRFRPNQQNNAQLPQQQQQRRQQQKQPPAPPETKPPVPEQ